MRRLVLVPLAVLCAAPAISLEPLMPPHIVAETFCVARIAGDMTMIEPYLTDELADAIGQAMAQNDVIQKQHPDEKPPLGDGVPWATYQDAVPSCVVDYEAAKANPGMVPVIYAIPDAPDASWSDTLVLRQVQTHWKLDDIVYQDGARLTDVLVSVFGH
jgi:hypothetical protein